MPLAKSQDTRPALQGVTVLDVSRVLAGPYCTMLLADLGADVVKIERPPRGDDTRTWGPPYLGDPSLGLSAYYLSVNRGKRSLCLDLKSDEGRQLLLAMVERADVLVENFAPGVAERLQLTADAIAAANPRIVHCSITAFGPQAGPAYDLVIQGMSGLMSITGTEDGPPLKVGVAVTDVLAGLQAANAILAALMGRERSGRGDRISVTLMGSAVAALVNIGQAYFVDGQAPRRWGNAHPQIVPYQVFASADGHFTLAAGNDKLFTKLCHVIGRSELAQDTRFATNPSRVANRSQLIGILEPLFAQRTTAEWLASLRRDGVPCGPVASLPALFGGDPLPGVEMFALTTASADSYRTVGPAIQMSGRNRQATAAPLVGEHTDQVLQELLGLEDRQLERLREEQIIQSAQ